LKSAIRHPTSGPDPGDAGSAHQRIRIDAVTRKEADPDVGTHVEQKPGQIDGLEEDRHDFLGELHRLFRAASKLQHRKFALCDAGHIAGVADGGGQPRGDLLHQLVDLVVTERLVDLPKARHLHAQQGERPPLVLRGCEGVGEQVAQAHSVRQPVTLSK